MLLIRKISVEEESGEKLETEKCNSLHWQISSDQMKGFKDEDNYKTTTTTTSTTTTTACRGQ